MNIMEQEQGQGEGEGERGRGRVDEQGGEENIRDNENNDQLQTNHQILEGQPFSRLLESSVGSVWNGMMTLRSLIPISHRDMQTIAWKGSHPHSLQSDTTTSIAPPIRSAIDDLVEESNRSETPDVATKGTSLEKYRTHIYEMSVFKGVYVKPRSKSDAGSHAGVNYAEIYEPLNKLTEKYRAIESVEIDERVPPPMFRSDVDAKIKKERSIRLERFRHKIFTEFNENKPDDTLYPSDDAKGTLSTVLFSELNKGANCSVNVLREIVWENGCSAKARHIVWPILLGYVPTDAAARERVLCQKRKEYADLVETWHVTTIKGAAAEEEAKSKYGKAIPNDGHVALVKQIHVDVLRTHPEGFSNTFNNKAICDMLNRLLIVWSRVHSNVGYFQGLNELPTTFIMVFIWAKLNGAKLTKENLGKLTTQDLFEIEADSYWCLCSVMKQIIVKNIHLLISTYKIYSHIYFVLINFHVSRFPPF